MPPTLRSSRLLATLAVVCIILSAAPRAGRPAIAAETRTAERRGQAVSEPQFTIQARVPLTIVDVTVTDAKGNPVHGLKESDFTILEDNKEMKPNSFEEHRTDQAPPQLALIKHDLPPNTFSNSTPAPPQTGPLNILLLDSLNTAAQAQQQVSLRMVDFVNKMKPGTQVAVFRLTTRLTILQGFTSDRELLKAALTSKSNFAWPSPIGDDAGGDTEIEGAHSSFQGQFTLAAMRQIARYASGLPGRKNLIWFSGSFPQKFPPVADSLAFPPKYPTSGVDPDSQPPIPEVYDFTEAMGSATDLLARAHVVLYPIDWRGPKQLQTAKTQSGLSNLGNMLFAERGTMQDIADQTGGKFFYNTNAFAESIQQAIDHGSNFYTITYAPTNQQLDTRFRTISVKVDQRGLHLDYRNGYYAVDPGSSLTGLKVPRPTAVQSATLHGAPDMTEILFKVKTARASTTEVSLPADNQRISPEMKPPYRRYMLSYTADIHNIAFPKGADGNYTADFEFQVTVFSAATGDALNTTNREVRPVEPASNYQSLLKDGAIAHQEIDVPAKGDFFLRIVVHDLNTDRVGALEIPTTSIKSDPVPGLASGQNP